MAFLFPCFLDLSPSPSLDLSRHEPFSLLFPLLVYVCVVARSVLSTLNTATEQGVTDNQHCSLTPADLDAAVQRLEDAIVAQRAAYDEELKYAFILHLSLHASLPSLSFSLSHFLSHFHFSLSLSLLLLVFCYGEW